MLKKLILFLLIIVVTACSFDESAEEINNRRVTYRASTIMTNVELVVNYFVENNVSKSIIIDEFPWEIEANISPYNKMGMSGYLRYKDESLPPHTYIEMRLMVDVGNIYLNKTDTIIIRSVESGFTDADLKKNTIFELLLDPLY